MSTLRFRPSQIIEQAKAIVIDKCAAKLLQKSEMRKDIVIELSYKGFG